MLGINTDPSLPRELSYIANFYRLDVLAYSTRNAVVPEREETAAKSIAERPFTERSTAVLSLYIRTWLTGRILFLAGEHANVASALGLRYSLA